MSPLSTIAEPKPAPGVFVAGSDPEGVHFASAPFLKICTLPMVVSGGGGAGGAPRPPRPCGAAGGGLTCPTSSVAASAASSAPKPSPLTGVAQFSSATDFQAPPI